MLTHFQDFHALKQDEQFENEQNTGLADLRQYYINYFTVFHISCNICMHSALILM